MTIKDVEERTGLSRSNIRFYEKEKLIEPSRNESNGYRDYGSITNFVGFPIPLVALSAHIE